MSIRTLTTSRGWPASGRVTWRNCSKPPGLRDLDSTTLTVHLTLADFNDWWEPFTLGVGPAGDYVARLDADGRERLKARCAQLFPSSGPFEVAASAWTVLGRV